MNLFIDAIATLPIGVRLIIFAGIAVVIHLVLVSVRYYAGLMFESGPGRQYAKVRTIGTLATSAAIFTLYFLAFGLMLRELGVSLTAYLASASIVGLAIGFGSQGVVQDVVTGVTLVFSDQLDVGDLVEISGQTGIVKTISMRFIELQNGMGASVFIPNRTITNVINYPRGYVRCIVDITLGGDESTKAEAEKAAATLTSAAYEEFPGILLTEPSVEGRVKLSSGKEILRVKFRVWPGRGQPIETVFVQELTAELKKSVPTYESWMIAVTYEAESGVKAPDKPSRWPRTRQARN